MLQPDARQSGAAAVSAGCRRRSVLIIGHLIGRGWHWRVADIKNQ